MLKKYLSLFLILIAFSFDSYASHFLGADITYECTGNNVYSVTLTLYRDCGGVPIGGSETVRYKSSCGNGSFNVSRVSKTDITPLCPSSVSSCSGGSGYGVEEHVFKGTLNLSGAICPDFVLSWDNCCRNAVINTLNSPGSNNIYVETELNNTLNPACNSSPVFNNTPASYICRNQPFVYNHGVNDVDGDSLHFSIGPCYQTATGLVTYSGGFNGASPLSTSGGVSIDPATGAISFTPTTVQVGIICVIVKEYRNGVKIGEVNRDMQFNVVNCTNVSPSASGVNGTPGNQVTNFKTSICASAPLCFTIDGTDPDLDIVNMTWNNEIPTATFTVTNNNTTSPQGQFCWTPTPANMGNNIFTVNVEDDNCPIVGTSTFTYIIEVLPSPNTLTVSNNVGICKGGSTTLTATTMPGANSITWSPATGLSSTTGASVTASPTTTTTYTVSASFPDGCNIQKTVTVTILPPPVVSITPSNVFTCSGSSVSLNAVSSASGYNFQWLNNANASLGTGVVSGNSSSILITAPNLGGVYHYKVKVTNPINGCVATDTVKVTIAQPTGNVCNVLYVSTAGLVGNPGTKSAPTTLNEALIRGACNGTVIKMAQGTYTINNPIITLTDYITLEGGYNPITWDKVSTVGATTIHRSALNVEDLTGNAPRLVAFEINNKSGFRFQDITISVADAPAVTGTNRAISTYGIYMNGCSNYNIVRTKVNVGKASNGIDGVSPAGVGGVAGGNGGNGGNANQGCKANGAAGTSGTAAPGGGAGGGGGAGATGDNCNWFGCDANPRSGSSGSTGTSGTAGTNASAVAPATNPLASPFFIPNGFSASGTNGTGGGGGGGGGGMSKGSDCTCSYFGTGKGGNGGAGGKGGLAGTGGSGGGGSFGLYIVNNLAGGNFRDVAINQTVVATGGAKGIGQAGTNGTAGGPAQNAGCGGSNANSGAGGNGGNGRAGGNGQPGANGVSTKLSINGVVPTFIQNSVSIALSVGVNNPIDFNLAGQAAIQAEDINCTATNVNYAAVASNVWNLGLNSTPNTPTGSSVTTQYSSLGRKNIVYGGSTYTGFSNMILDAGVLPTISTNATLIGGKYRICAGTSLNFSANEGGVGYIYHWNLGGGSAPNTFVGAQYENLNNIAFNTPGIYTIQLQYETNCCGVGAAGIIVIHVETQPVIGLPTDVTICADAGVGVPLVATGLPAGGNISWTLPSGLNRTDTTHVIALPSDSIVYNVTISDSSGLCTASDQVAINVVDLVLTASVTDQLCLPDGSVNNVTVTGGSGNYTYSYDGNNITFPTPALQNLNSGSYVVNVIDNTTGCTDSIPVYVDFTPGTTVFVNISEEGITCNGAANATLKAYTFGGAGGNTFVWYPTSLGTNDSISNVAPGNYSLVVTNSAGCTDSAYYTVLDPPLMQLSMVQNDSASCPTTTDGTLEVLADGGAGGYTYLWNTGNPADNAAILTGVGPGYYCVAVSDVNGCAQSICDTMYSHPMVPWDTLVNICQGESYFVEGAWQTVSGVYNDTLFGSAASGTYLDTLFYDTFDGANTWTFNTGTGSNEWTIGAGENGAVPPACSPSPANPLGDKTMHITNNLFGPGMGALYIEGGGLYNADQNTTSTNISTIGRTSIVLNFDFIANGNALIDNASVYISVNGGTTFIQIDNSIKSPVCGNGQGQWTFASYPLPVSAENINNLKVRLNWTNVDDGIATDPSVAINNLFVTGVAPMPAMGCDTLRTVNLVVHPNYNIPVFDTTICQSDSYTLPGGAIVNTEGIYIDTFMTASGCDSIVTTNLMVDSFAVVIIDTAICQGESLTINGVTYNTNQSNTLDTVFYVGSGCDSVHYDITLHIDAPITATPIDTTICQGESITVNGVTYSSNQVNTLDTAFYIVSGCDSMYFDITLHIDAPITANPIDTTICPGESIVVNGVTYNTAQVNTLDTAFFVGSGCDSMYFDITLSIDTPIFATPIDTTICPGESITVNGVTYNTTQVNTLDTAFYTISGCDSMYFDITLHIDVPTTATPIDTTICQGESILVNGVTYSTTQINTLDTAFYTTSGCDSMYFDITLHVNSPITATPIDTTVCPGESITVNGVTYSTNQVNTLDTAYFVASGCDSMYFDITLHIGVPIPATPLDTTICLGQSIVVNGITYSTTQINTLDTAVYAVNGCDSMYFDITLHIDTPIVAIPIDTTICQGESITVNGVNYSTAQTNTLDTAYFAVSGCDSMYFDITLHINAPTTALPIDTAICPGESITVNGVTYNTTQLNTLDTAYFAVSGCDSMYFDISLRIDNPIPNTPLDTTICQGESITVNGVTYSTNQTNTLDTAFYNVSGCDSMYFDITLHVDTFTLATQNLTICAGDSAVVNGVSYKIAGTFNDTINHIQSGCDSIRLTINVTVNPTYNDTLTTSICANALYTLPDGTSTNTAGTYHYLGSTALTCDSLYTVVLSVKPLPTGTATAAICAGDSIFLGNAWRNTAGSYIDTLANGANCDSIVTTTLTINALPNVTANASGTALCQGEMLTLTGGGAATYVWTNGATNGAAFSPAVGSYTYIVTGTDANSCIDTASIKVVVSPKYNNEVNVEICEDALPYTFPDGTVYNTAANFVQTSTLNTINMCDSIIKTNLTINKIGVPGTIPDTIAVCESFNVKIAMAALNMQSYQWQLKSGSGFVNLSDTGIYSGTNTATLTISPLDISLTGNVYRVSMVDECGNGGYTAQTYLRVSEPHDVENPMEDIVRCLSDNSLIYVDYNGYDYVWSDGQTGQFIKVDGSGTYAVTFKEKGTNCAMEDEFEVLVEDCIKNCVVTAPTGFSPQATKGANDIFKVLTSCKDGFSYFNLSVYNRWGEMVYQTKDPDAGWDGRYKNQEAEVGVYIYLLEYTKKGGTTNETLKGQITLIR